MSRPSTVRVKGAEAMKMSPNLIGDVGPSELLTT